jgi:hypothetical protein
MRAEVNLESLERLTGDFPALKASARGLGPTVSRYLDNINSMFPRYRGSLENIVETAKVRKRAEDGEIGLVFHTNVLRLKERTTELIMNLQTASGVIKTGNT